MSQLIIDCPYCKDTSSFEAILKDCRCNGTQLVMADIRPLTDEEAEKSFFGNGKINRDRGLMILSRGRDPLTSAKE